MTKQYLRKTIKQKRDAIPQHIRQVKSEVICEKLFALPEFKQDMTNLNVMSFFNFASEVNTALIHQALWQRNANIYLPRVKSIKDRTMDIVLYTKNTELIKSNYGILEPEDSPLIESKELNIIIVPALAFDQNLNRLGYGGGFYDALLASLQKTVLKVGICFAEQLVSQIPINQHDEKVDLLIFH